MSEESENLEGQAAVGEGGAEAANAAAGQKSWRDSLPDDLKTDPTITKFTDIAALAKSYVNAQRLIGRDKIPMPQTDEDYLNVFRRLGAPESPDGYEFTPVEWPEGFKMPETDTGLKDVAAKLGLTKKQADAMNKWHYDNLLGLAQNKKAQMDAMREKTMKSIQDEWGDAAKGNMELAKRVINDYSDDSTKQFLESTGLGNDANLLRVFGKIGQRLVEDRVMEGHKGSGMSPQDLQGKIKTLQAHPAYTAKNHPEHKSIVGQVQDLFQKLHPA